MRSGNCRCLSSFKNYYIFLLTTSFLVAASDVRNDPGSHLSSSNSVTFICFSLSFSPSPLRFINVSLHWICGRNSISTIYREKVDSALSLHRLHCTVRERHRQSERESEQGSCQFQYAWPKVRGGAALDEAASPWVESVGVRCNGLVGGVKVCMSEGWRRMSTSTERITCARAVIVVVAGIVYVLHLLVTVYLLSLSLSVCPSVST